MERFEIDKEVEEKVNQILQKVTQLPLEKILSYAVKGEEDAIQLYKFLSQKIEEPHAKMKFEQFVRIESKHKEEILKVFEELFPGIKLSEVPLSSWVEVSSEGIRRNIKSNDDYLNILEVAISSEKLAEKMYLFIAQALEREYADIFTSLAGDEKQHYDFLVNQYLFYKRSKAEEDMHKKMDKLLRGE